jgi:hypothetical protein
MPEPNEPSETIEQQTVPDATAIEPEVQPAQEPRQSEEARRIQAAKDAEIARIQRGADEARAENEVYRQEREALQYQLAQMQAQNIPDEQARAAYQQRTQETAAQRQIISLQQKAAKAEVRVDHPELSTTELDDLLRISKNEKEFKQKAADMAEGKKKAKAEQETERERLRKEIRSEVEKELGVDRVSTATPGTPTASNTEYRKAFDEAQKNNDPAALIRLKYQQARRG